MLPRAHGASHGPTKRAAACVGGTRLIAGAAVCIALGFLLYLASLFSANREGGGGGPGGRIRIPTTMGDASSLDGPSLERLERMMTGLQSRVDGIATALTPPAAAVGDTIAGAASAAAVSAAASVLARLDAMAQVLDVMPGKAGDACKAAAAAADAASRQLAPATPVSGTPAGRGAAVSGGSQPRPRNAVVGMAKNIDLLNAYRFVRSLRVAAPAVRIVIFSDDNLATGDLGWMYRAFGVEVVPFDVAAFAPAAQKYHPSSYRWMLIRDWMRGLAAADRPDNLLFIDVRDSVFQSDPFAPIEGEPPGFYAFLEAKPRTIRECDWNAGWVKGEGGAASLLLGRFYDMLVSGVASLVTLLHAVRLAGFASFCVCIPF